MGNINLEEIIAEQAELYTAKGLARVNGVSLRAVRRWAASGQIEPAARIGNVLFYQNEWTEKNPLHDKGEKHAEGREGATRWYDPFDLT